MYKLIIFDLDGTLLDTAEGVRYAMKETLLELGEKDVSNMLIDKFIGPPITESFCKYLGFTEERARLGADIFKRQYQEKGLIKAQKYHGIEDVLKSLGCDNRSLAVATNKTHENAIKILEQFKLNSFFQFIQGNIPGEKFDKADIICKCMEIFNVQKRETVLVGDARQDEKGAEKAGIDFIAVTYGYGFSKQIKEEKINCIKICNSPKEITEFLYKTDD